SVFMPASVLTFERECDVEIPDRTSCMRTEDGNIWLQNFNSNAIKAFTKSGVMLELELPVKKPVVLYSAIGASGNACFVRENNKEESIFHRLFVDGGKIKIEENMKLKKGLHLHFFGKYYGVNHEHKIMDVCKLGEDYRKGNCNTLDITGVSFITSVYHRGKIVNIFDDIGEDENHSGERELKRFTPDVINYVSPDFEHALMESCEESDFVYVAIFDMNTIEVLNPLDLSIRTINIERPPNCKRSNTDDEFFVMPDGKMSVIMADEDNKRHLYTATIPEEFWKNKELPLNLDQDIKARDYSEEVPTKRRRMEENV
ncbi:hypothetical protein PFISCL1PPCAC_11119, partial [Pristionchus fissidentatus]